MPWHMLCPATHANFHRGIQMFLSVLALRVTVEVEIGIQVAPETSHFRRKVNCKDFLLDTSITHKPSTH